MPSYYTQNCAGTVGSSLPNHILFGSSGSDLAYKIFSFDPDFALGSHALIMVSGADQNTELNVPSDSPQNTLRE